MRLPTCAREIVLEWTRYPQGKQDLCRVAEMSSGSLRPPTQCWAWSASGVLAVAWQGATSVCPRLSQSHMLEVGRFKVLSIRKVEQTLPKG